jgi:sterol O-acyltransferase
MKEENSQPPLIRRNSLNSNISTRSVTVQKLKSILKEHEREEEKIHEFINKKEDITNMLKSTLNLISDNPREKFENISHNIKDWIECNKIEAEMIQNSLEELKTHSGVTTTSTDAHSLDKIKKQHFREKTHLFRESHLSVLFHTDKNLKSLYYLILNLFVWLLLWVMINDLKKSGQLIDTKFWRETFSGIDKVALLWILMFLYSHLIIFYVKFIEFSAKKFKKINYIPFFTFYLIYLSGIYVMVFFGVENLKFPCKVILGCESTRICMKIHGYFREKILYGMKEYHMDYALFTTCKNTTREEVLETIPDIKIENIFAEFKKFLYFIFCPSLIFRDSYPRITRYRWNSIFAHLANFIFCILFYYILMRYICDPYFSFSKIKDYYSIPHFVYDTLRFAIPGLCFLIVGFFLLLHSWLNLWSEILRHGDRRFYEDWWNCTNFEEYYRKWNMVVHEWLYYYVYNDTIRVSLGKSSRIKAKINVFALSVIVHEIIVWIAMGFFFPILSFFFGGPGIIFTFIKTKKKEFNLLFWMKLFIGKGLIFALYLREYYVRNVLDQIGLIESWHEWVPRSILMFTETYKKLIVGSKFY